MLIQCLHVSFVTLTIIVNVVNLKHDAHDGNTLEMVHVIFRHGDRTSEGYPNDPYINNTYYPYGIGQLTNAGKTTSYKLGQSIRNSYGRFLGDVYTPNILKAFSSPYTRCQATLLVVLAALFPPKYTTLRWNHDLDWQPIAYDYNPLNEDKIFLQRLNCPNIESLLVEHQNYAMQNGEFDGYEDVLQYIKDNSGVNLHMTEIPQFLLPNLKAQEEWGLSLPAWTDSIWPEPITTLAGLGLKIKYDTDELNTAQTGYIMSQIMDNTYQKINGTYSIKDRKIELYSAHENNVAGVLSWLGVFKEPYLVPLGAYVSLEIHNNKGFRSIKVYYQNYSTPSPRAMSLPNCGIVCPLDKFVNLYEPYFNAAPLCY